MTVASSGNATGEPDRLASRRRLAFWVWMSGIALIVTGAALVGDSTAGGGVVGTVGVILCVIGWFTRISTEQPAA